MANDSPNMRSHLKNLAQWTLRFACIVMALAVLGGFVGSIHPVIDVVSHYQVHMLLGGAVLFGFSVLFRVRATALIILALCVVTVFRIAPYWFGRVPDVEGVPIRVMSANVFKQNTRIQPFLDEIKRVDPDVLAIIEVTELWEQSLRSLSSEYPYSLIGRRPGDRYYGVAIFSKYKIEAVPAPISFVEFHFRSVVADVRTPAGPVRFIVAHPRPPTGIEATRTRDLQLGLVNEFVRSLPDEMLVVVLGDLNTTPWSHGYRTLIKETTLRNTGRGAGILGSWHTSLPSFLRIPIDHILVDESIGVRSVSLGSHIGSDHLPIIAELSIPIADP